MNNSQIKKAVTTYVLAGLADLNQQPVTIQGKTTKQWSTIDSFISKSTEKNTTISPLSISNEVLHAISLILMNITTLISNTGKLHIDSPITKLLNTEADEFNIVYSLFKLTEKFELSPQMTRNFNFIQVIISEMEKSVSNLIDPGANSIAELFLNFIRLISQKCSRRINRLQRKVILDYNLFTIMMLDIADSIGNSNVRALIHYLDENKFQKVKNEETKVKKASSKKLKEDLEEEDLEEEDLEEEDPDEEDLEEKDPNEE